MTQDESGLKATIEDHSTYGSYISGSKVGRGLRRMIELPGIVHLDQSGLVRLKIAVPAFNSGEAEVKR